MSENATIDRIEELLRSAGYVTTTGRIAGILGVDNATVWRWTQGKSTPTRNMKDQLEILIRVLERASQGDHKAVKAREKIMSVPLMKLGLKGILIAFGYDWLFEPTPEETRRKD